MKDMVSSTGKFILDFQKNKKLGYPTLILLSICISNCYRNTTHTGTYTETYTEPALEPSLKNTALGFPPTDFGFTKSRWWWHEWNELHVWFDEYFWDSNYKDTTKKRHFQILENICHQSSDKVLYTWTAEGTVEHQNKKLRFPVEEIPTTIVVNHVPHERIFVSAVFSVDKNVNTKVAFSEGSSVGSGVG